MTTQIKIPKDIDSGTFMRVDLGIKAWMMQNDAWDKVKFSEEWAIDETMSTKVRKVYVLTFEDDALATMFSLWFT